MTDAKRSNYRLYVDESGETKLRAEAWADLLNRARDSEDTILRLWMRNPRKGPIFALHTPAEQASGPSSSTVAGVMGNGGGHLLPNDGRARTKSAPSLLTPEHALQDRHVDNTGFPHPTITSGIPNQLDADHRVPQPLPLRVDVFLPGTGPRTVPGTPSVSRDRSPVSEPGDPKFDKSLAAENIKRVPALFSWPIADEDGIIEKMEKMVRLGKVFTHVTNTIASNPSRNIVPHAIRDDARTAGYATGHLQAQRVEAVKKFGLLWDLYVPDATNVVIPLIRDSIVPKIYWGAVLLIVSKDLLSYPEIVSVDETVRKILEQGRQYKLGVYCEQMLDLRTEESRDIHGFDLYLDRGAFLLETTIDSFVAVLNMVVAAARRALSRRNAPSLLGEDSPFRRHAQHALGCLVLAEKRTIADLNRPPTQDDGGKLLLPSVITPEAILMRLLDRLVDGIYLSGSLSVIRVYDERLQTLVSG